MFNSSKRMFIALIFTLVLLLGAVGCAGPQGPAGPAGPEGIQGEAGIGVEGPTGPQGIQGEAGIGVEGPAGPQGPAGADGKSAVEIAAEAEAEAETQLALNAARSIIAAEEAKTNLRLAETTVAEAEAALEAAADKDAATIVRNVAVIALFKAQGVYDDAVKIANAAYIAANANPQERLAAALTAASEYEAELNLAEDFLAKAEEDVKAAIPADKDAAIAIRDEAIIALYEARVIFEAAEEAVKAAKDAVETETELVTETTNLEVDGTSENLGETESLSETDQIASNNFRVTLWQNLGGAPKLGMIRPGYGTSDNEVGIVVGVEILLQTPEGEVVLGGGCQQVVLPPNTYCRNCGGDDWGYQSWKITDTSTTSWENELAVLAFEAAQQQVTAESCPDLPADELLKHVFVLKQAEDSVTEVVLTPWHEYRRASGEDNTIMFAPGDKVYGWNIGLEDSQDNICDGGGCYLPSAPTWGWVGGGIVNSIWEEEIPSDAVAISEETIQSVLETLN